MAADTRVVKPKRGEMKELNKPQASPTASAVKNC